MEDSFFPLKKKIYKVSKKIPSKSSNETTMKLSFLKSPLKFNLQKEPKGERKRWINKIPTKRDDFLVSLIAASERAIKF